MTKQELRHEYFAAKERLNEIMLEEYNRHGEESPVPEMWEDLHKLWDKMNEVCGKI